MQEIGNVLILEHEPDNKYDANAIKVLAFDEGASSVHIGYIARHAAAKMMQQYGNQLKFGVRCITEFDCINDDITTATANPLCFVKKEATSSIRRIVYHNPIAEDVIEKLEEM